MGSSKFIPCVVLFVIFISYLCLGALIFSRIEGPKEEALTIELVRRITEFLDTNECVDVKELKELVDVVIEANELGIPWSYDNTTSLTSWDFWSSLFFTTMLITTIGFANAQPAGDPGKLFCILYAMVGVPLSLIFLTMLMTTFHRLSWRLYVVLEDNLGIQSSAPAPRLNTRLAIRMLHLCIIITLFALLFIILPGTVFYYLEPTWSYIDCYYFIFVSLTTIGLGDFITANDYSTYGAMFQTIVSVYLVIGLTVLLLIIELLVTIPEVRTKLNILYGSEDDDYVTKRNNVEYHELSRLPSVGNGGYSSMDNGSTHTDTEDLLQR